VHDGRSPPFTVPAALIDGDHVSGRWVATGTYGANSLVLLQALQVG
jgi:hypothetical protein